MNVLREKPHIRPNDSDISDGDGHTRDEISM